MSDIAPAAAPAADAPAGDLDVSPNDVFDFETPAPGAEAAPAAPVEPAPVADPFEEFGGRSDVEAAVRLWKASQTDQGVVDLFIEAGRSLGLSVQQMQTLFGGGNQAEPEPEDLDRPLTVAEFQEMQRKAQAQQAQQAQAATMEVARTAAAEELAALGLKAGSEEAQLVLTIGDKFLDKKHVTAEGVKNAIRRGHAEYQAQIDAKAKEYLLAKRQQAQGVPSSPAGAAAPSDGPASEPKDISEAIKLVRQRLGIGR